MKKNIVNFWMNILIFVNFQHDLYRGFTFSFPLRSERKDYFRNYAIRLGRYTLDAILHIYYSNFCSSCSSLELGESKL